MLADAPGAERLFSVRLVWWSTLTFPVVVIAALVGAWGLYLLNARPLADGVSLLPLVNVGLGLAGVGWWGSRTRAKP